MIAAIVPIVAIVTGAASHSLAACALASSPKKTSIYLYKKEKAVADTQALTIETIAPIGRRTKVPTPWCSGSNAACAEGARR